MHQQQEFLNVKGKIQKGKKLLRKKIDQNKKLRGNKIN